MDTKEAIKVQFMNEYARKVFSDITVKGLCAATPVARTTFYSYYNNTDEVRCEIEDELINGLLEVSKEISADVFRSSFLCRSIYEYLLCDKGFCTKLFRGGR